jgi:hypothetical protein
MVGLTNLYVFKIKDKETYNHLHTVLTGWCFFRNEGDNYYVKAPLNKTIENLIDMGSITELNQTKTEV